MPDKRPIELKFPMGGQDEAQAYQNQHPYTTPDSQNVRPHGTIERRARGGSRPGLTPSAGRTGGTPAFPAAIRMLTQMDHQKSRGYSFFTDDFNTPTIGGQWGNPVHIADTAAVVVDSYESKYASSDGVAPQASGSGAYLRALASFDSTADYMISIEIDPFGGSHQGANGYSIWFAMGDSTPNLETDGAEAKFNISGTTGVFTGSFTQWEDDVELKTQAFQGPGTDGSAAPGVFSILVSGLDITAYWRGVDVGTITLDTWGCSGYGERVGFGIYGPGTADTPALVNWFRIEYKDTDTGQRSTGVIVSGGVPYREAWIDRYTAVAHLNSLTLPTDKLIRSVSRGGLLYITEPTNEITFYTEATDTLSTLVATEGSIPANCCGIDAYRDRCVVAIDDANPNQWYMSRQGTWTDWDYAETDAGAAVSGSTNAAGQIGEPIRAITSWLDDYFLFGCTNSLWVLQGDPSYGGSMFNLSTRVGVVDLASYCFGPSGEFIFLSADGLYAVQPGGNSTPQSISRDKLPQELRHVDKNIYTVLMAYDHEYRGVHIYLTAADKRAGKHWWVSWPDGTFWPVALQGDHEPTAILEYRSYDPSQNAVQLGCRDFDVRKYNDNAHDDDGTEITSYVSFGPLRLSGDDYHDGMVAEMWATLAAGSGDVTWSWKASDTPEGTIDATAQETGTWVAGFNGSIHPRVRAKSGLLRLENADTAQRWAYESGGVILRTTGKHRKA